MARATPAYVDEEAKRELLATIHAARELGPEMDSALIERCAQQLSTLYPEMASRTQQTQATLTTLMASVRESDPANDEALAAEYLTRLRTAPPQAVTPAQMYGAPPAYGPYGPNPYGPPTPYGPSGPPGPPGPGLYIPIGVIVLGVIVAIAVFHTWWLIWLIPLWSWLGWGRRYRRYDRYNRRYYRDQRRMARWEYRNRMRGPNGGPPLPPNGPEIL